MYASAAYAEVAYAGSSAPESEPVVTPAVPNYTVLEGTVSGPNDIVITDDAVVLVTSTDPAWPAFVAESFPTGNTGTTVTLRFTFSPGFADDGVYTREYQIIGDPNGPHTFTVTLTVTNNAGSPTYGKFSFRVLRTRPGQSIR